MFCLLFLASKNKAKSFLEFFTLSRQSAQVIELTRSHTAPLTVCSVLVFWLFLFLTNRGAATELANWLKISPAYLSQMATSHRKISAERCFQIEQLTGGIVTRKDLRPNDWHLIWPELANNAEDLKQTNYSNSTQDQNLKTNANKLNLVVKMQENDANVRDLAAKSRENALKNPQKRPFFTYFSSKNKKPNKNNAFPEI